MATAKLDDSPSLVLTQTLSLEEPAFARKLAAIEAIYQSHFEKHLSQFKVKSDEPLTFGKAILTPQKIVQNSGVGFYNSWVYASEHVTQYQINFMMQLGKEELALLKKSEYRQLGFFNFNLSEYGKVKISYFSEIHLKRPFQGLGLSKLFIHSYQATLLQLNVDLDHLHVKSNNAHTAQLYKNLGYRFTPKTLEILDQHFGGEEEYLKDSSVSNGSEHMIEMFRVLNQNEKMVIKTTVDDLKTSLHSSN